MISGFKYESSPDENPSTGASTLKFTIDAGGRCNSASVASPSGITSPLVPDFLKEKSMDSIMRFSRTKAYKSLPASVALNVPF